MTGSSTAPSHGLEGREGALRPGSGREAHVPTGRGTSRRSGALHIDRPAPGVRWLLFGRLAVGLFIIAYVLISTSGWGKNWPDKTVYAVVTGVLALNVVYLLLLGRVKSVPERPDAAGFRPTAEAFIRFQIGVDIAVEAVLVFLTGGASSQLVTLFMFSIMSASLLLSWRAAVAFASEAAALHVAAAVTFFVVPLTPTLGLAAPVTGSPYLLSSLFFQLLAFFAVAFLSGLLEHRLTMARLLSHDILEAIGQGLIVADPRGRILFWNDEAHRLLGEGASPAVRTLDEALPGEVREALVADPITGEAHARGAELARPGGGKVPVTVTVRPVLSDIGRQAGTLVVVTDRSLERRFEEATLQAQRSEAVTEMAAAIAHEIRNPLAAVRASVQEISRRSREPPGEVPSDSVVTEALDQDRSPDSPAPSPSSAGMQGAAGSRRRRRTVPTEALFDIVLSESDRLDAIITDFLAFAKMRPVRREPCDIARVVKDAAMVLRQLVASGEAALGRPVEIVTELDGERRCRADAQQLQQVLLNLGMNSLHALAEGQAPRSRAASPKAAADGLPAATVGGAAPDITGVADGTGESDAGLISLRIMPCALLDFPRGRRDSGRFPDPAGGLGVAGSRGTEQEPLPGERAGVQLEVEDNGCGMSSEVRRRALDPFFTRKERGTGLGLAVVDRIVKSHDGLVRIGSEPGRGTRVSIWLPAEE